MSTFHFAGINGRDLAEHARSQDVLVSYADLRSPGCWAWMRPLLEGGHFRTVILDSGAFTVYAAQQRGAKVPEIRLEDFAAFAAEHQTLFTWVANFDDIGGDVAVSNSNFAYLVAAGLGGKVVPVWHEGESDDQLRTVIAQAQSSGRLAIGMQRPKGSLVPRNVVACLRDVMPKLASWAPGIRVHGFGLTRYARPETCPCGGEGWAFDSVDSTTWIAEACAVQRSGACGTGQSKMEKIAARRQAFRATIDSYRGLHFDILARWAGVALDTDRAIGAGSQAKTVAERRARI